MSHHRDALAFVLESRREDQDISAVYVDGNFRLPLVVAVGRSQMVRETADGGTIEQFETSDRDFLIGVDDLVMDGQKFEPRAGAFLHEAIDDVVHVWKILPMPGVPHCEFSDRGRSQYRVHTKRTAENP